MYSSSQGSSIHGIFQARILEWVAISFSRGLNLSLLHWQAVSLPLSHPGSPRVLNTKDKLTLQAFINYFLCSLYTIKYCRYRMQ